MSIMHRSFAEFMGVNWPPEVAYRISDGRGLRGGIRDVTWAEVGEQKRRKQRERLERIREPSHPRFVPAYAWTFYNSGWIYMGWHCYVVTRTEQIAVTFRGLNTGLAESIMRAVPLGMFPVVENFERWMESLAKQRPRRKPKRDRRRAGSVVGWLEYNSIGNPTGFSLQRPQAK